MSFFSSISFLKVSCSSLFRLWPTTKTCRRLGWLWVQVSRRLVRSSKWSAAEWTMMRSGTDVSWQDFGLVMNLGTSILASIVLTTKQSRIRVVWARNFPMASFEWWCFTSVIFGKEVEVSIFEARLFQSMKFFIGFGSHKICRLIIQTKWIISPTTEGLTRIFSPILLCHLRRCSGCLIWDFESNCFFSGY